jgi:hypothetical protein
MKRLLLIALVLVAAYSIGQAQKNPKSAQYSGYLVDHMCGKHFAKLSPEKAEQKAARHTKECALDDNCKAAGFGIVTPKGYYKLDPAGNRQAEDFLNKTKLEDHIKVEITGSLEGAVLNVVSLRQIQQGKKNQSGK